MPAQRVPGKPSTRRYSEQEKVDIDDGVTAGTTRKDACADPRPLPPAYAFRPSR
jgi:hypothetical protein